MAIPAAIGAVAGAGLGALPGAALGIAAPFIAGRVRCHGPRKRICKINIYLNCWATLGRVATSRHRAA